MIASLGIFFTVLIFAQFLSVKEGSANLCNTTTCQSAIDGYNAKNWPIPKDWWNEGQGCHGCPSKDSPTWKKTATAGAATTGAATTGAATCDTTTCQSAIDEYNAKNWQIPKDWWNEGQGCHGCPSKDSPTWKKTATATAGSGVEVSGAGSSANLSYTL